MSEKEDDELVLLRNKEQEEGIVTNDRNEKIVTVRLPMEVYEQLLKIQKWYRSPTVSHTFRLLIPDAAKGIEQDQPLSRIAG